MAEMDSGERDVLRQLFFDGPTFDGDICTKVGRDSLFKQGLANRHEGYSFLTLNGVKLAMSKGFMLDVDKDRRDRERRVKLNNS